MTIERALTGLTKSTTSAVYIEDCFSCYLYTGTGASQTITNGIDLATNGGLVWIKNRSQASSNRLWDSTRSITGWLQSDTTDAIITNSASLTSLNTDGFTAGTGAQANASGSTYASWTFRKQAKFFTICTWTGTGVARTISHDLGSTPGMIIVKRTDNVGNWQVYHRSLTSAANSIQLNLTNAQASATTVWNSTAPTSSVFSVGTDATVNASGGTYVAYLFAHDAGGFGAAGTDSVVACGSYTGNGSASGPTVTLGWEPQFVLIKMSSSTGNWQIFDNMRGISTGGVDAVLLPNSTGAEDASYDYVDVSATGFNIKTTAASLNTSGGTYIYLAIRRGPMKTPTDATKVFAPVSRAGTGAVTTVSSGFVTDLEIVDTRDVNNNGFGFYDRLRGANAWLKASATSAESSTAVDEVTGFDVMNGVKVGASSGWTANNAALNYINYMLRRAPGFFDVVCYTGTGANTTVAHGLTVAPEMVIVKKRTPASTTGWLVYSSVLGNTKKLYLNTTSASATDSTAWNSTTPTSSVFSVGTNTDCNASGATFVAYLFATCSGVSKVGSYTGNGSSQTINCGFTSGARFVLIKRADSTGSWWVFDSARGIVSASDPALQLNSTAAEVTSADAIDPDASGFIVNQEATCSLNVSSATYIYLAIA